MQAIVELGFLEAQLAEMRSVSLYHTCALLPSSYIIS